MKQFQAEKLDLKSMVRVFGGLDPVETTNYTEETETTTTVHSDGFNDHNNNGELDECETIFHNTTTTIK